MNRLYTVTITDLGTFEITVAATDEKEAASIAKAVLYEEATQLPSGTSTSSRAA